MPVVLSGKRVLDSRIERGIIVANVCHACIQETAAHTALKIGRYRLHHQFLKGDSMFHICIVEDDSTVRNELKLLLERALYCVTIMEPVLGDSAPGRLDASLPARIAAANPDLVLLDVHLPGENGCVVCERLRQLSDVPVIFLTACTEPEWELTGMLKGGDDYITKPFVPSILLARIAAVLKRTCGHGERETRCVSCRGVVLDLAAGRVSQGDQWTELTKQELRILYCLFSGQGTIVSRRQLMDDLWDNHMFIDDNTLSVHVTRLRAKLEQIGAGGLIETRRGMGYQV